MKNLFGFLILLLSYSSIFSQTTGLRGNIYNAEGTKPLTAASIKLTGNDKDTIVYTNALGSFEIPQLKEGTYELILSFYNPVDSAISGVKVIQGQWTEVKIKLKPYAAPLPDTHAILQTLSGRVCGVSVSQKKPIGRKMKRVACPKFSNGPSATYRTQKTSPPNTEEYKYTSENEFKKVNENPLSTFSIDVDNASYSNIRRFILQGQLPPQDAVRIEEMINYFTYQYPQPSGDLPFAVFTEAAPCPWNKEHLLVQVGVAGKEIDLNEAPANNLTFLIDVSGSMSEELELIKSSLKLLVNKMRSKDKVAIVVYAGAAGMVLPPTSGKNKDEIMTAIENLSSGGSTAGGEGILLAYNIAKENFSAQANNRIILATDGDFNVGLSSEGDLTRIVEEKRNDGIFLTVLGFGEGNYKDSKMEMLADKGNGNYYYIDNMLEAQKVLIKQLGGTLYTIAKDVKLQVEFNPVYVKEYRLLGYENRLLNNEDFENDSKDAGELGAGHRVTALYEIIPAGAQKNLTSNQLRYQETMIKPASFTTQEMMYVKIRYKKPGAVKSDLTTHAVSDYKSSIESCSNNFKFCAAVAAYGQQLRQSKFKGDISYEEILRLAISAKDRDEEGYRAEFIRLVEMTTLLRK